MIPDEDRGPSWLRDYGYTDFGDIDADMAAMEEFAKKLQADVENNYSPHMTGVGEAASADLPQPDGRFIELTKFLMVHHDAQDMTVKNVYHYATGTTVMATAASEISKKYRGSDAFANARVGDVQKAFDSAMTPPADSTPTTSAGGDV